MNTSINKQNTSNYVKMLINTVITKIYHKHKIKI